MPAKKSTRKPKSNGSSKSGRVSAVEASRTATWHLGAKPKPESTPTPTSGASQRTESSTRQGVVPDDLRVTEVAYLGDNGAPMAKSSQPNSNDSTRRRVIDARQKYRQAKIGLETQLHKDILHRVRDIRTRHPEVSAEIDLNEFRIKNRLRDIRSLIDQLPEADRELVTVLVVDSLTKWCDSILVDPIHEIEGA